MTRAPWIIGALLATVGCGGESGTCDWPARAQTASDASPIGCSASAQFQACEQRPDGSQACRDLCKPSEYALNCNSAMPDDSLACKVLPIPTPMNVLVYCCPCAP